jgi:hypothetical protein
MRTTTLRSERDRNSASPARIITRLRLRLPLLLRTTSKRVGRGQGDDCLLGAMRRLAVDARPCSYSSNAGAQPAPTETTAFPPKGQSQSGFREARSDVGDYLAVGDLRAPR